jgi:hypothetical protein
MNCRGFGRRRSRPSWDRTLHLPVGTEENLKNPHSGYPVFRVRFETNTFWIQTTRLLLYVPWLLCRRCYHMGCLGLNGTVQTRRSVQSTSVYAVPHAPAYWRKDTRIHTQTRRTSLCSYYLWFVLQNLSVQLGTFRIGCFTIFEFKQRLIVNCVIQMLQPMPSPVYVPLVHIAYLFVFGLFNDVSINSGCRVSYKHCRPSLEHICSFTQSVNKAAAGMVSCSLLYWTCRDTNLTISRSGIQGGHVRLLS